MADISPELRIMLIEFRRARITEANAIAALLALDVVRTEAEWRRRMRAENPVCVGLPVKITREMVENE